MSIFADLLKIGGGDLTVATRRLERFHAFANLGKIESSCMQKIDSQIYRKIYIEKLKIYENINKQISSQIASMNELRHKASLALGTYALDPSDYNHENYSLISKDVDKANQVMTVFYSERDIASERLNLAIKEYSESKE